jgi:hypothetical protein
MAYAALHTRNASGLHPNFRAYMLLGGPGPQNPTLTPTAAMQQAIAAYSGNHLNNRDFQNTSWLTEAESQIAAGAFDLGWYSPSCSTAPSNVNLFQTASGLTLGTTAATVGILGSTGVLPAAAIPVIGPIIAGVGVLISIIGMIFAHHAAAVKRDLSFGCSALPAVNNSFALVAQAVSNGQMTAATAAAGLIEIYKQFMQAGGASGSASGPGSIPSGGTSINDSPYCNSNCEMSVILYAMVLYWQAQYEAMAASQAAAAAVASSPSATVNTSQGGSQVPEVVAGEPVAASSGLAAIPGWAWIALGLLGAWAVL